MQDILVVTDMQNDFIDGSLGTKEAVAIVPKVLDKLKAFKGTVIFTRDTHDQTYFETQEGRKLPVSHCVKGTQGWDICPQLDGLKTELIVDKKSFGSCEFGQLLVSLNEKDAISSICFVGLCTDICVLSNAMIAKAFLPEVPIIVDASCCAGVSPESHTNALNAMKVCQIEIINE